MAFVESEPACVDGALLILQKPLLFRSPAFHAGYVVGKAGDFFANKAAKPSILASFYISIFISLSAHADFSVWALFFFCLSLCVRCLSRRFKKVHWAQREGAPCGTGLIQTRAGAASGTAQCGR